MTMQINVDPAALTQEQREAVAGFILAYPGLSCTGVCGHGKSTLDLEVRVDTTAAHTAICEIHEHAVAAGLTPGQTQAVVTDTLDPEIAALVKDDGEFQASVAFGGPAGDPVAAAVFGSAPAPLPLGATAAPSIAAVAPSLTAPAVMPATTSTATLNVPAPPAPTSANAAAIAAPQTGNPAGGVELDKNGLPWDGRIHAESKAKIADGTWRKKRNLDPAILATVEAELRAVMGAAPAAPLAPVAPIPAPQAATVTMPTAGVASSAVAAPVPPAPPAAPVAPVPPAPSVPGEVPQDARQQFVGLVGRASAAIQGGKVTQAEVTQCCAAAGVPALPLLANRLDLVAQVAAQVDALIASRP